MVAAVMTMTQNNQLLRWQEQMYLRKLEKTIVPYKGKECIRLCFLLSSSLRSFHSIPRWGFSHVLFLDSYASMDKNDFFPSTLVKSWKLKTLKKREKDITLTLIINRQSL